MSSSYPVDALCKLEEEVRTTALNRIPTRDIPYEYQTATGLRFIGPWRLFMQMRQHITDVYSGVKGIHDWHLDTIGFGWSFPEHTQMEKFLETLSTSIPMIKKRKLEMGDKNYHYVINYRFLMSLIYRVLKEIDDLNNAVRIAKFEPSRETIM